MTNRTQNYSLDQHYIDAYLNNPKAGKTAALKAAYKAAGITDKKATRQRAYDLHNRLREDIDGQLIKLAKDAKALGLNKLIDLCQNAENENVQLSAATTLTKDLFPNISIRKVETIEDIDAQLKAIEDEIQESNGLLN